MGARYKLNWILESSLYQWGREQKLLWWSKTGILIWGIPCPDDIGELRTGHKEVNQRVAAAEIATTLRGGGVARTRGLGPLGRSWNQGGPNRRDLEPPRPEMLPSAERLPSDRGQKRDACLLPDLGPSFFCYLLSSTEANQKSALWCDLWRAASPWCRVGQEKAMKGPVGPPQSAEWEIEGKTPWSTVCVITCPSNQYLLNAAVRDCVLATTHV